MAENKVIAFNPTTDIDGQKHRMEKKFIESFIVVTAVKEEGIVKFQQPIELRVYGTPACNTVCIWIHVPKIHAAGSGKANGYGYHRPSEAAQIAIEKAGIKLEKNIGGRGSSIMIDALDAIAAHLGIKHYDIIHAHG